MSKQSSVHLDNINLALFITLVLSAFKFYLLKILKAKTNTLKHYIWFIAKNRRYKRFSVIEHKNCKTLLSFKTVSLKTNALILGTNFMILVKNLKEKYHHEKIYYFIYCILLGI